MRNMFRVMGMVTVVLSWLAVTGCQGGNNAGKQQAVGDSVGVQDSSAAGDEQAKPKQRRVQGPNWLREVEDSLVFTVGDVRFKMVGVKANTSFIMGVGYEEYEDYNSAHEVWLCNYYIGETEVTQALWKAVMGSEPEFNGGWKDAYGKGDQYPVYRVSYDEVVTFILKLRKITGELFRLPTEAEWEFAALGGRKSHGYRYSGSDRLRDVAWCSGSSSHPVAQRKPNELGLYDMTGNVFEWCLDWYCEYDGDEMSPIGANTGDSKVMRGGCWMNETVKSDHFLCQVTNRECRLPNEPSYCVGFRLVL